MFYMQNTKMLFGDAKDTCDGTCLPIPQLLFFAYDDSSYQERSGNAQLGPRAHLSPRSNFLYIDVYSLVWLIITITTYIGDCVRIQECLLRVLNY